MTTKKYADYIRKQCKTIFNLSLEPIFNEYIVEYNGKRIGVLLNSQLYLISTEKLKKLLPDAIEENPFKWAYYKLVFIENTEDIEILKQLIITVYNDLYFQQELVCDISYLIQSYSHYSDIIVKIYDLHVTFLRFCYEKQLIKYKPLDKNGRIVRMNYVNKDLTEAGTILFTELYNKWLTYTDKNDEKTDERINNVKMLEKYYTKLLQVKSP